MELLPSGILEVSTCFHRFRSLSRDPLTDVRRAVSEYSSLELSLSKEFHGVSVGQNDALEIDGNRTRFFFVDCVAKRVHVLFCNPAAYAQHHNVAVDNSVESPGHFETADEAVALLLICAFPARLFPRATI
jgi:hypothetical protein